MRLRTDAATGGCRDPGSVRRCPVVVPVGEDGVVDVVALAVVDDHLVPARVRALLVVGAHTGGKDREERSLEGRRSAVEAPEGPHCPKMNAADPEVKDGPDPDAGPEAPERVRGRPVPGAGSVNGRRHAVPRCYGRLSATSEPGIGTTIRWRPSCRYEIIPYIPKPGISRLPTRSPVALSTALSTGV